MEGKGIYYVLDTVEGTFTNVILLNPKEILWEKLQI